MMVQHLNQLEPRRHLHWDTMFLKSSLAEPTRASVTLTPNTRSQALLASQFEDILYAGPTPMPVHRPSSAPPPAYPWKVRPTCVPMLAGEQSNIIATYLVVRGQSVISMPRMGLPRCTSSGSTHDSVNERWDRRTYLDDAVMIYKPPPPGYPKVKASSRE